MSDLFFIFNEDLPDELLEPYFYDNINTTKETQMIKVLIQEIEYIESLVFLQKRILMITDSHLDSCDLI